MNRTLYTRKEAAEVLRIHVRTLDAEERRGSIRAIRIGTTCTRARVLYKRTELERYIDEKMGVA